MVVRRRQRSELREAVLDELESAPLLATPRGTPFLYQGEEIGMTNHRFTGLEELRDVDTIQHVRALMEVRVHEGFEAVEGLVNYRSRDNARTPMQWSDEANGGITEGEPWLPVNGDSAEVNVEREMGASDSIWAYYRDLIELRSTEPTLLYGDLELLQPDHPELFVYGRRLDDDRLLVAPNVSDGRPHVPIPAGVSNPTLLIGNYPTSEAAADGFDCRPYEARVYRL